MAGEAPLGTHEPAAGFVAVSALLLGVFTSGAQRWTKVPYSVGECQPLDRSQIRDSWKLSFRSHTTSTRDSQTKDIPDVKRLGICRIGGVHHVLKANSPVVILPTRVTLITKFTP